MRSATQFAALCGALLSLCSCSRRPPEPGLRDLVGTLIDLSPLQDYQRVAPVVLAGVVTSNEVLGPPRPAAAVPGLDLVPRRVSVAVEEVLRGATDASATFVYFESSPASASPNPFRKFRFGAVAGQRYLFYLTADAGGLRAIGDDGPYTLAIHSGKIQPVKLTGSRDWTPEAGRQMAELLLTLRPGANSTTLAASLDDYRGIAGRLASRALTAELLERLAREPGELGAAACVSLAQGFYGYADCLRPILKDGKTSPNTRRRASSLLDQKPGEREELLAALAEPNRLFLNKGARDDRIGQLGELTVIVRQADHEVRALACAAFFQLTTGQTLPQPCRDRGRQ